MSTSQETFDRLKYDIHVDANGKKVWYKNGVRHREDDLAIEEASELASKS